MIRRIDRIEYAEGEFITLPTRRTEQETVQELYRAVSSLTGASYEYDLLGSQIAPKKNAIERMAFMYVGSSAEINRDIDLLRAQLHQGASFKVWTIGDGFDEYDEEVSGIRRWAYGRVLSMPSVQPLTVENRRHASVHIVVERFSDWFDEEMITEVITLNGATETFSIINPGLARVFDAKFTLAGTFVNPRIENLTNGYVLESLRDGSSANHRLRFDADARRVEWSEDAGVTYVGDYANFVRNQNQIHLMILEAATNSFEATFGATPNGTLTIEYFPTHD